VLAINGEPMPPAFRYSAGAILILAGFVYFVAHASWGSFRRVTIDRAKRTIRIQEGPWRRVRVYRSPDDVELRIMDATREPDDSGQFRPAIVLPEVGRDRVIVATHRALRSGKGATAVGAHLLAQVRNLM